MYQYSQGLRGPFAHDCALPGFDLNGHACISQKRPPKQTRESAGASGFGLEALRGGDSRGVDRGSAGNTERSGGVGESDKAVKAEAKVSKNHENCRNSSLVGIRKPRSRKCATDANKDEKVQQPILDIEALRTVGRIVRAVKERIEASQSSETGSDPEVSGDSGSSVPASPDRSQDYGRGEENT